MANLGSLLVTVGAKIDGFESGMEDVSKSLNKALRDADKAVAGFDRFGDKLTGIGSTLSAAITLPLAGLAIAAVKVAGDFELSMNKIKAFGDITGPALERLRQQALQLGKDTQFSAQQAADAMVVFAAAGQTADQIYAAMPGTLALAAAGQMQVGEAAKITSDILGQFGLAAGQSGKVADVLAVAAAEAKASLGEMGLTLTYVGPIAKGAGQSLEETVAAIVALDAAGVRGERAGTGLRGVIGSLVSPSKDAQKYLDLLGVSISDSAGTILPLSDIMERFKVKLGEFGSEADKQRILFEIFGREAATSAQVLINTGGPALDAFQAKLETSGGAADKMAKTINTGFRFAMEQFKGSVETAGIAIGTALLPVVNRALTGLTEIVNKAIIPAVEWFSKLSAPIQNVALGVVGLAAAAGPMLLVMGQMFRAFASVSAGVIQMRGMLSELAEHFTSVAGKAQLLYGGLIGLAVLIGTTLILEARESASSLRELMVSLEGIIPAFGKVNQSVQAATAELTLFEKVWGTLRLSLKNLDWKVLVLGPLALFSEVVRDIADAINALRNRFPQMDKAVESSVQKLQEHAKAQTQVSQAALEALAASQKLRGSLSLQDEATKRLTTSTETHGKSVKAAAGEYSDHDKAVRALNKSLDMAEAELRDVQRAYQLNAASLADVDRAQEKVKTIIQALHPEWKRHAESIDFAKVEAEAYGRILKGLGDTFIFTTDASKLLTEAFGDSRTPIDEVTAALRRQGIVLTRDLKSAMDKAIADYETLADAGVSSADEMKQAWIKMQEAIIAYKKAMGEATGEMERALERLSDKTQASVNKQKTIWQQFLTDLKQGAISMFASGLTDIIFGTDRRAHNQRLKEEEEGLKRSLDARTAEWEKYQVDATKQLENLRRNHAEQLAEQEADLAKALAEKRKEYEDYAADVERQISTLREVHRVQADEEIAEVRRGVQEKEQAYAEYALEVADRIADIRRDHARQLAEELDDLADNLRDRTQQYEDFVADANLSLQRIGEKVKDDIEDEKKDTKRKVDDKIKQYRRDEEDVLRRIAELEAENKESNREQIEDLRRSLARKKEDLDEYTREAEEDLAEYTAEHLHQAKQQEDDIATSLSRRKRDHDEFVKENTERVNEVTAKHKEAVDEQTADLTANLKKRADELDTYRKNAEDRITAITKKHADKLAEEEADLRASLKRKEDELNAYERDAKDRFDKIRIAADAKLRQEEEDLKTSLDNKAADYETYKRDIFAKLEELKDKHRTIWGDIGDLLKSTLSSIGQSLMDFIFKTLIEGLVGKLSGALGGIFGGGGITGGTGGGSTGGGSTGGGGTFGGATAIGAMVGGPIGAAIGAAVDLTIALANVFGGMRRETTLNAIEENTRFAMIWTGGMFLKALEYWPGIKDIHAYLWDVQAGALKGILAHLEVLDGTLKSWVAYPLAQISDLTFEMRDRLNEIRDILSVSDMAQVRDFAPALPGEANGGGVIVQLVVDGRVLTEAMISDLVSSGTRT